MAQCLGHLSFNVSGSLADFFAKGSLLSVRTTLLLSWALSQVGFPSYLHLCPLKEWVWLQSPAIPLHLHNPRKSSSHHSEHLEGLTAMGRSKAKELSQEPIMFPVSCPSASNKPLLRAQNWGLGNVSSSVLSPPPDQIHFLKL